MEEITAVQNPSIVRPGTTRLDTQSRNTLIKKANIPKVIIDIGRAISCKIGFMRVLTIPITIAATIAAANPSISKPGTRYATTYNANILRISLMIILIFFLDMLTACLYL